MKYKENNKKNIEQVNINIKNIIKNFEMIKNRKDSLNNIKKEIIELSKNKKLENDKNELKEKKKNLKIDIKSKKEKIIQLSKENKDLKEQISQSSKYKQKNEKTL
ncbi:MAG: hypothetical protein U1E31_00985 [Rickettsiales bacterium]